MSNKRKVTRYIFNFKLLEGYELVKEEKASETDKESLSQSFKEYLWISSEGWHQARSLAGDLQKAATLLNKRIDNSNDKSQLAIDATKTLNNLLKELTMQVQKVSDQQRLMYQSMMEINKVRVEQENTLALRTLHLEQAMERLLIEKYGGAK